MLLLYALSHPLLTPYASALLFGHFFIQVTGGTLTLSLFFYTYLLPFFTTFYLGVVHHILTILTLVINPITYIFFLEDLFKNFYTYLCTSFLFAHIYVPLLTPCIRPPTCSLDSRDKREGEIEVEVE